MTNDCKTLRCNNPNSIFKGILAENVIDGSRNIGFVFYPTHDKCFWPVNTTYFELIKDGWKYEIS